MSLNFVNSVVYQLEQRYGKRIDLIYKSNISTDLVNGKETCSLNRVAITRAAVLPNTLNRNQFMLAHGSGEQYVFRVAGNIDQGRQDFIINKKYLKTNSGNYDPTPDWWIIFNNKRFNIKTIQDFHNGDALYITTENEVGADRMAVFEPKIKDSLILEDTCADQL